MIYKICLPLLIKTYITFLLSITLLLFLIITKFTKINIIKEFNTFDKKLVIFIIIMFTLLCLYTLYKIIKWPTKQKQHQNKILIKFATTVDEYYFKPLKTLDNSCNVYLSKKYHFKRITYINKFLTYLYINILKQRQLKTFSKQLIIYFNIKTIPKLIISIGFLLDVFYFQQFYYFYLILPLALIILLVQYFKYILFAEYKELILFLENKIEVIDTKLGSKNNIIPKLTIKEYLDKSIEYQIQGTNNPFKNNIGFSYQYFINRPVAERNKNINYNQLIKKYIQILNWVEKVHLIYISLTHFEISVDNYVNLYIFFCYLIGWIYIFINFLSN